MTEKWKEEGWAQDFWYSGKVTRRTLVGWGGGVLGAAMLVPAPWRAAFGAATPYKIGSLQPLSGAGALGGKTAVIGLQMAIDRINAAGGVNGRPLEAVIADDESKPDVGRRKTQKLLVEDNVDVHVMLCHWRYVFDNLFGKVKAVSCLGVTHIPKRIDENGKTYDADADDAAYATFMLENGVIAHMNSSWCVRVRRDDLVTFQVDGTHGSAVAGLTKCWTQHRVNTPRPVWNPDIPQTMNFSSQWEEVPENIIYENGFKLQWEDFIRHVAADTPWHHGLIEGVKGVQLAELGMQSWAERHWVDVPDLKL